MKAKNKKMVITKEQILKIERTARRNVDIELQVPRVANNVHASKKTYKRKAKHLGYIRGQD